MKKLLIILSSFSLGVPITITLTESFSHHNKINESATVSINDGSSFQDVTHDYFSEKNALKGDFTQIESVNIPNLSTMNLVFGLNKGNNEVSLIKTGINGKTSSELFFKSDDQKIRFILGRGSFLRIYRENDVISFDMNSAPDLENIQYKTVNQTWFNGPYDSTKVDNKFEQKKDIKEAFNNQPQIESLFISPQRGVAIVNVGSLTKARGDVFNIADDGTMSFVESISGKLEDPDYIENVYGIFYVGSGQKKVWYMIAKTKENNSYPYATFNLSTGVKDIISLSVDGHIEEHSTSNIPPFIYHIGEKFGIAYNDKILMWNQDTGAADTKLNFTAKDIIFTIPNHENITYVSVASAPSGEPALLIGTEGGEYSLHAKSGTDFNNFTKDIVSSDFEETLKISNDVVTFNPDKKSAPATNDGGKIYTMDGAGNIGLMHRKIDLGKASLDLSDAVGTEKDNKKNSEKVDAIYQAIASANGDNGKYFSVSDVMDALGLTSENLEQNGELNNLVNGDVKTTLNVDFTKGKWFTDPQKLSFFAGGNHINTKIFEILKNLQIADDNLTFDVDYNDFLAKINIQAKDVVNKAYKAGTFNNINDVTWNSYFNNLKITGWFSKTADESDHYLKVGSNTEFWFSLTSSNGSDDTETGNLNGVVTNVKGDTPQFKTSYLVKKTTTISAKNMTNFQKYATFFNDSAPTYTYDFISASAGKDENGQDITLTEKELSKYLKITNESNGVKIAFTKEKYEKSIDLKLKVSVTGGSYIDTTNGQNSATIDINVNFSGAAKLSAIIGGSVGGVAGAALVAFLIFAFIRWWWPMLLTKRANKKLGGHRKAKAYNRLPQELADRNATWHDKKHQVKTAKAEYQDGIQRSGVFDREIEVNEKTKFNDPSRVALYDDDTVVNNWATVSESGDSKHPRISYTKKTKVDAHDEAVAKKMLAKKAELDKNKKD